MGLIREPEGVDFYVVDRQPTAEESRMMSERIRQEKAERAQRLEKSTGKEKKQAIAKKAPRKARA